MRLGGLPQCLLVLAVLALEGIRHELLVDQYLRVLDVVLLELFNICLRAMMRRFLWFNGHPLGDLSVVAVVAFLLPIADEH
jgi:hypothetical protein